MTNRATLLQLRDRLKAATGPDRELDAAIMAALFDATREKNYWLWQSRRSKNTPNRPADEYWLSNAPALTASLDAAVTLVPEGWVYTLTTFKAKAHAYFIDEGNHMARPADCSATPALALCLARLEYELARSPTQLNEARDAALREVGNG